MLFQKLFIFYALLHLNAARSNGHRQHQRSRFYEPLEDHHNSKRIEKELPDDKFDYEDAPEETLDKREANINEMTDDEIALALSRMSVQELAVLDQMIEEESDTIEEDRYLDKREALDDEDQPEEDYDEYQVAQEEHQCEDKRCGGRRCNVHKKSAYKYRNKRSDMLTTIATTTTTTTSEAPKTTTPPSDNKSEPLVNHVEPTSADSVKTKRHASRYQARQDISAADKRVQAKINFLREKFKRDSMFKSIDKRRSESAVKQKRHSENPYFNSLLGPQIRRKREYDDLEHTRLLAESFPNPTGDTDAAFLESDTPLVRVKRSL